MTKPKQSRKDLESHLQDLTDALKLSSKSFDEGYRGEAKRLATAVRVLLHDTRNSHSLLGQLGMKLQLEYFSTPSPYQPGNLLPEHPLIMIESRINSAGESSVFYMPVLDELIQLFPWERLEFNDWWDTQGIIRDGKGNILTRKDITRALANQDGGAHVDPTLEPVYADLSRNNSLEWHVQIADEAQKPLDDKPEWATMRQIAHELIKTLEDAS